MILSEKTKIDFGRIKAVPKEAVALYLTHFLRTFSLSLPGIYTPIFIFSLAGKPILFPEIFLNNFVWVSLYYLGYAIFVSLANILLTDFLFRRLGFRNSILLSMICLVGLVATFFAAEKNFIFIFFSPILMGLATHFYWIPFHVFFLRKANSGGNFGDETASQMLTATLASALGPVAAGLILNFFSFNVLFLVISILFFVSSLPVLFWVNDSIHGEHRAGRIFSDYILNPKFFKLNLAFIGNGIDGLLFDFLWPILLFFVLKNFISLGGLVSFSTVLSILIMFWIGRLIESKKADRFKKASTIINALLYLPRIFVATPLGVFFIDLFDRFNGKIYSTALVAEIYDKSISNAKSDSDFIIYRETITHLGQILGMILCLVAIIFLPDWRLAFLIPGLAAAFVYLIYI